MAVTVLVFALLVVFLPILNTQINQVMDVHYQYQFERSLKTSIQDAFELDEASASFAYFKEVFLMNCPKGFSVNVELVNFENYPKFVHYKINANHDLGLYSYTMEMSMIEEDKDENSA